MPPTDLATLLPLAHEAMDLAVEHFKAHRPSEIMLKGDRDVVTDLDFAIEDLVKTLLRERTPEIGFLGEETGLTGDSETYWVLDPIDGTANFMHGLPLCGVILALVYKNAAVLGMIDLPFLSQRYHATKGAGAYRNGESIKVSGATDLSQSMVSVSDYGAGPEREVRNEITHELQKQLAQQAQRVRGFGSAAIDLVWVAEGKLDANLTLGNKPWDTAAGVLIAREAGAVVFESDGSPHTLNSRCVITTTPGLQDALLPMFEVARGTAYWPDESH